MLIRSVSENHLELLAEDYRDVCRLALCTGEPLDPKKLRMVRHAFVTFIIGDLDNVGLANDTEGNLPRHESGTSQLDLIG